jgi:Calx-beta domain
MRDYILTNLHTDQIEKVDLKELKQMTDGEMKITFSNSRRRSSVSHRVFYVKEGNPLFGFECL